MPPDTPRLPEFLPILERRMAEKRPPPAYLEPEITQPVDLCDERGYLNPAAVGWSRQPLVRANLKGHWPRKKRWNFWNWISPEFVLSVTLADIDFASFCSFFFIDFESGEKVDGTSIGRPGRFELPEHVGETIHFQGGGVEYAHADDGEASEVRFRGRASQGSVLEATLRVQRPAGHESLNIVVPWTRSRFQLNSKHNTLPCSGQIALAGRRYSAESSSCHAVQDFGRGIWPYRSFWNWGVATGVQDGELIGINVGARWTTGTGINENGIFAGGRLYKIMEDLDWSYDPSDPMGPWRVRTLQSDAIDLTLRPRRLHRSNLDLGLISSGGVCAFGAWNGIVRFDGREVAVGEMIGWAEEFSHRW